MENPLPNHVVNLPDDEQIQPEPAPSLLGFAPAVLDIPNNNNGWIEEDPEEDPEMEEEEEEEMEIKDEMNDPEIINPYEIEEGELPPPPVDSDTSSDSEPKVEAEDEDENKAAIIDTITHAPYRVQPFSGTTYVGSGSSRKVFALGSIGKDVYIFHRKIIMENPLPNHVVNLPDDEQIQPEPAPSLLGFAPAVLDIPNNNNGWIEEDPEEDPEMEEEEEEEMEIKDEMNDPEIINPYEIEEGELPPPPVDSDTSSDSEPKVEAEDEDENKATIIDTITHAPYRVQPFSGTTYVGSGSSHKVFALGSIGKDVYIFHRKRRSETREHYELDQSVSTLEDQMRGLMLEDKEENERLKKKLKVSQQEKEQMEQAFHHVVDWIHRSHEVDAWMMVSQQEKKMK
nr:hypothetical protein [Tanacetum cinerariifolium]